MSIIPKLIDISNYKYIKLALPAIPTMNYFKYRPFTMPYQILSYIGLQFLRCWTVLRGIKNLKLILS